MVIHRYWEEWLAELDASAKDTPSMTISTSISSYLPPSEPATNEDIDEVLEASRELALDRIKNFLRASLTMEQAEELERSDRFVKLPARNWSGPTATRSAYFIDIWKYHEYSLWV